MRRFSRLGIAVAAATLMAFSPAPELWLAPSGTSATRSALSTAVNQLAAGKPTLAMPSLKAATSDPVVGGYALLYQGRAELALGQTTAANRISAEARGATSARRIG